MDKLPPDEEKYDMFEIMEAERKEIKEEEEEEDDDEDEDDEEEGKKRKGTPNYDGMILIICFLKYTYFYFKKMRKKLHRHHQQLEKEALVGRKNRNELKSQIKIFFFISILVYKKIFSLIFFKLN